MVSKLHQRLGTAGFVIAIIALLAALGSGAYAASGALTSKQKKEVEKIAKKFAGKPGTNGTNGTNGTSGAKGEAGAPGTAGTAGKDGVSVTTSPAGAECPEGGTKFTSVSGTSHVCNGEEGPKGPQGEPWTVGNVLPPKAMETGAYSISSESGVGTHFGVYAQTDISFTLPLASPLPVANTIWLKAGTTPTPADCENSQHSGAASPSNPEAAPGFLCVFEGNSQGFTEEKGIFKPDGSLGEGTGVSGASLLREPSGPEAFDEGTWAVTAP